MTDTELHELEFLAREATPGPWRYVAETCCEPPFETAFVYGGSGPFESDDICLLDGNKRTPGRVAKDAAYIAAVNPKTVLWLLVERRIVKNEIKRLKEQVTALRMAATVSKARSSGGFSGDDDADAGQIVLDDAIRAVKNKMVCGMNEYWVDALSRWLPELQQLRKDYARLEKEADWLAQTAANNRQGRDVSSVYMREQARRAVREMGND